MTTEPEEIEDDLNVETFVVQSDEDNPASRPGFSEEAYERREQAFNARYQWRGKAFDGVSASRKDTWRMLCNAAGFISLEKCFDDPHMFYAHSKALIYICLAPKDKLKKFRAAGIEALLDDYEDWVDRNIPTWMEKDAYLLGLQIFNDSHENRAEAAPSLAGDRPGKH